MPEEAIGPVLRALSLLASVPVVNLLDSPAGIPGAPGEIDRLPVGEVTPSGTPGSRYLLCRYYQQHAHVIAAGPYRYPDDPETDAARLSVEREATLSQALGQAVAGLGRAAESQRVRVELATELEMINNAVIAIASELDLELVLRRIVDLARDLADARYAALGVPDAAGEMMAFVTAGMTGEQQAKIDHPPRGLGVLGLLLREPETIRLQDLASHPASTGFPPNHPPMKSFLGVPIVAHGRVLGSLYLTEKRFASEFTDEDARMVEMLARHAGIAIENARLFRQTELQQQRLQLIIDQLPEAVVMVETDPEQVTLANRQASILLGWDIDPPVSVEEFLARNPRRSAGGVLLEAHELPLMRSLHVGEVIHQNAITIDRPYDPPIALLVNSAPLVDEHQTITGTIVVFQDITQIRDAEQLKDDFLSLVSHELRTPLTTIQGGAHMLVEDEGGLDAETVYALKRDIYNESRRLGTLVENMVQLANIRAGRFAMETEPVPVFMLVRSAIASVRESAPDREFRMEVDRELLVEGDYSRLDQVIRNLLHNAVKYAPDDSPIEVSATCDREVATISVRDYGPGIDPEDLPHVFDRFQRGARAVAGQRAGMGLGLYLSKHLVEAHGGRIWIERPPDSAGGGARVCFSVPVIDHEDE